MKCYSVVLGLDVYVLIHFHLHIVLCIGGNECYAHNRRKLNILWNTFSNLILFSYFSRMFAFSIRAYVLLCNNAWREVKAFICSIRMKTNDEICLRISTSDGISLSRNIDIFARRSYEGRLRYGCDDIETTLLVLALTRGWFGILTDYLYVINCCTFVIAYWIQFYLVKSAARTFGLSVICFAWILWM